MQMSTSITSVDWWSYTLSEYVIHPFIMIILCLLSVFVVLGNLLVVSAIWHENQLHSVTNYLIASLAAADCLVGLVVMPFSVISETIIGSWTFGPTWCDLWHSFDVLASTASILNLCAISFDRYLAITDPISYPTRMTPKRIAFIVISLWTCSSLISFPAIIWWRAVGEPLQLLPPPKPPQETITNTISSSDAWSSPPEVVSGLPSQFELEAPLYKCVFTDDTYYLLFSSIISFYGPAGVMLYAYYRIYKAAVKQTRFLKHGSKQVVIGKNKKAKRNKLLSENSNFGASERSTYLDATCDGASTTDAYDRQHLVLRAHRGGCKSVSSNCNPTIANGGEYRDPGKYPTDSQGRNVGDTPKPSPMNVSNSKHSHDGPSESTAARNESFHQKNKTISNRNHLDRVSLASSRRDKLRIYRQRFDSNPMEHDDQNEHASLDRTDSNPVDCRTKEADKNEEPLRVIDQQIPRSTENQETLQKLNSKSVVASMSTQSACIDVSVIHHYPALAGVSVECPTAKPSPAPASDGSKPGEQTSSCDISNYTDEVVKMENAGLASIADESDLDGDQCNDEMSGSGSSSSSSRTSGSGETYGTGSIASVLMRPRQTQKNSFENDPNSRDCCDSNGHLSGNPRMRRTLSFGEPRTLELRRMQREQHIASSDIKPGETFHPAEGTRLTKSRVHRASCGGTISTQRSVDTADVTASKASNLRSWVKFKSNNRKCASDLQGNFIPRPPRSLIPLMMMNSDTSTDSSIAASVFKQGEGSSDSGRKPAQPLTSGSMVSSIQSGPRFAGRSSEIRSMVIEPHSTRNAANSGQVQRSKDDSDKRNSGNKAQMLYFDSDRLIQSLVDLTSIHYIDCVNQADGIAQKKIGQDVEAAGGQGIAIELAKKSFDPNRSITPRQQRTVGKKKLSKLAKERKAAKTLGIVVGVFILCWLPFFVVNIIVALCGTHCIYKFEVFVAIVTWLGWLNSAMNPVIYACWSRDFRRAFKRVLCSWIEFICPYDGGNMARKLRLKKATSFPKKDAYLTRNVSSMKGTTSSTVRSGVSMNGSISRSLLSDQ